MPLLEETMYPLLENPSHNDCTGSVKQTFSVNRDYFLTHQLKHEFWVLKRTVSSRRFF